ncbi:gluconate 5-dehydrogenase [Fusarium austroafricanum]|uniref:Gluconate 5-dehydrogenase n=1 Tax=Fusarium austroafricanum TaxID=2364996 RepID=A0A8H4NZY7_9HYPO|nr:gluconate 5-dehydrogenase [Fusarium austroafricanum]
MSKQLLQTLRLPCSISTLRLTTPLVKNSCITASNQLRTFQSSIRRDSQHTHKMSGKQPASGGEHRDFSRDALFDLSGKVALVTGGGSGIGLMATQALAVNGAKVYITGRTKEKLDRVVEQYGKNIAGEIIPIQADVGNKEGIQKLYEEYSSRENSLCILVNNAGISSNTFQVEANSAQEMRENLFDNKDATFEDWNSTYNTNVTGLYFTTAAFLPLLQKSSEKHQGWSSTVINISSISGLIQKSQHHFAYNASKGAAVHLTRMLAAEICSNKLKIRVNSIAPGVFPSEMTTDDSDENQKSYIPREKYAEKVPAGRAGKDQDMAATVLFFATNQYLVGQTIAVDGGYTIAAGQ